jgi:hypothetical protein
MGWNSTAGVTLGDGFGRLLVLECCKGRGGVVTLVSKSNFQSSQHMNSRKFISCANVLPVS